MAAPTRYTTLAGPSRHESERVKGSRFVADLAPVADEAAAEAFVAGVRDAFPDASHHVLPGSWTPRGA